MKKNNGSNSRNFIVVILQGTRLVPNRKISFTSTKMDTKEVWNTDDRLRLEKIPAGQQAWKIYSKTSMAMGIRARWNVQLCSRPRFIRRKQSDRSRTLSSPSEKGSAHCVNKNVTCTSENEERAMF